MATNADSSHADRPSLTTQSGESSSLSLPLRISCARGGLAVALGALVLVLVVIVHHHGANPTCPLRTADSKRWVRDRREGELGRDKACGSIRCVSELNQHEIVCGPPAVTPACTGHLVWDFAICPDGGHAAVQVFRRW